MLPTAQLAWPCKPPPPNDQQRERREDIKETQHKAERAAEAADDFARVGFLQIRIQNAEADGEAVEREGHHGDDRAEKYDVVPGIFSSQHESVTRPSVTSSEAKLASQYLILTTRCQPHRRHADDPQPPAFERKLREKQTAS